MEKYTYDRLNASERPFQRNSRFTHFRFLLPRLGLVLLAGFATVLMAGQSAGTIDAKVQKAASGKATVTFADSQGTLQATLNNFVLSGAPAGAHLVLHIHAKNTDPQKPGLCKGPVLFTIKATQGQEAKLQVDGNGKFSTSNLNFTVNNDLTPDQKSLFKESDFTTWLVNVHNADKINPVDNKPVSIVCGPIKAAAAVKTASGQATVTLAGDQGTLQATLNNFVLSDAPAGVHLVLHIHAKNTDPQKPGLCKGPVLFIIKATQGQEAKLQVDGNGKFSTSNLKFTVNNDLTPDQKTLLKASDFTTWLVNVHNADKINPVDNKPVSIVCGPIKAAESANQGTANLQSDSAKPDVILLTGKSKLK